MATGLTGAEVHSGSWGGLPDYGVSEWLQGKKTTTPPSTQTNWGSLWNQAWNAGYNQANSQSNPYSGQAGGGYDIGHAYVLGQEAYRRDNSGKSSGNNGQVLGASTGGFRGGSGGGSLRDAFNAYVSSGGYGGWDMNSAWADFQAKGGNVGGGGGGSADDAVRRWEEETRKAIESGYGEYESRLRGLQSQYETNKQESLDSAAKVYEQIFGGLGEQKTANLDKLKSGKEEVQARQASSIKELQENLANVLRGATMRFGAAGAGDTSATRVMLPYAYTKMAGAQEGEIRKQSNQQLFQIAQEERDTELQFSNMWRQTEVEKENSLQGIRDYYGEAIRNVQSAMAQAPTTKAQALANLNQSLLSEALANLRQLEAEDRQRKENIRSWATNRMSELNNMKLQLAGSASFNPQDILWNELSVQGVTPGSSGMGMDFSDYVTATRKKYLGEV